MKKSTARVTVVVICLIAAVIGYFTYLVNRTRSQNREASLTQVENVLSRDLKLDYPSTPKEVLKYHNDILKCLYNEECTEAEIEELTLQLRKLFDQELLDNNRWDEQIRQQKLEIQIFKNAERRIISAGTASSTDVVYYDVDGFSFARILGTYSVREGKVNYLVKQVYLMRKDEDNRWKIYGWDLAANLNLNNS